MIDWRAHLTDDERKRLKEIEEQADKASVDRRRIYQRAWRRAKLAGAE